jgi:glycosyltransferase involved in cell wall biosynthesis
MKLYAHAVLGNIEFRSVGVVYSGHMEPSKRIVSFVKFAVRACFAWDLWEKPDMVVASSTPLTVVIPALFAASIVRVPFVFEVRDVWPDAPIQLGVLKNRTIIALADLLARTAYRRAYRIVALTEGIRRRLISKSLPEGKIVTVMNGADAQEPLGTSPMEADGRTRVVYAGSCGYNNAIEVFFCIVDLAMKEPEISESLEFVFIGDGMELEKFMIPYAGKVRFTGRIPKTQVVTELRACSIAILPQRKVVAGDLKNDSLPNKFFDYLGAGLPIVAGILEESDMARIIRGNACGIVSDPEDSAGMYRNLKRLLLDEAERIAMRGNAFNLAKRYSCEKLKSEMIRVLHGKGGEVVDSFSRLR